MATDISVKGHGKSTEAPKQEISQKSLFSVII